jgi:hypothetical protein
MIRVLAILLLSPAVASGLFAQTGQRDHRLFVTAEKCMACHNGLVTPSGEDVSIGFSWRGSMMANSARDPYWQGAVRREVMDHPEARAAIEDKCSTCHMPMARFRAKFNGDQGDVFSHLPIQRRGGATDPLVADGTSCTMCHQILNQGLGSEKSFTGGFVVDTTTSMGLRRIFGPYEVDPGRQRIMQSASEFLPDQASHLQSAEFCATCHTLFTHALGPGGQVLGELPEQVPYLEWRHSDYRPEQSCQSCHMRTVEENVPISSVLGEPRDGFSRHAFRGGNFFMARLFNRYSDELGVEALPQELEVTASQALQHLANETARISISEVAIDGDHLRASILVENLAGHKLPTAYPSRRVWIRFTVRDKKGALVFESGSFGKDGSIGYNDNDVDPALYEPHYEEIDSPGQVQIYEAIMVDHEEKVTTGLLLGLRFIKDNRLLPRGFDKATADGDVAVRGRAATDSDFVGSSDQLGYSVTLGQSEGPFSVQAELWYQPIAYRWAENLGLRESPETNRFISYYRSMAASSATLLAHSATRCGGSSAE